MRILVEPSDYSFRNLGDLTLLRAAVSRLAGLWPNAAIKVMTDVPDELRAFCPEARPVLSVGRRHWLENENIWEHVRLKHISSSPRYRISQFAKVAWRYRVRRAPNDLRPLKEFKECVELADLVVVAGMGGITDAFPEFAADLLKMVRFALDCGKYVAMVGQGFGPLRSSELLSLARSVLPRVAFIGLREQRASLPLLLSMGVDPSRIMITGDDTIEMAYQMRSKELGNAIGLNLRASYYSGVDQRFFGPLRAIFRDAALRYGASLLPIPISRVPGEADAETIRQLTESIDYQSQPMEPLDTLENVVEQIHRCRVVVTGSYHAGVFSLANGVPTIGLAASEYYADKFLGLSDMFGEGCQTVLLGSDTFDLELGKSIDMLWKGAERLRPGLWARAVAQIQLGHQAYERIRTEVMHEEAETGSIGV